MGFLRSVCPYCSCGCGMLLDVQKGKLVGTHPSLDGPSAVGSLCVRGWNAVEAPQHRDRPAVPLLREGDALVPVAAERAVETLAVRLETLRKTKNPSILFCVGPGQSNEDAFAIRKLARPLGAMACPTELTGVPTARRAQKRVLGRDATGGDLERIARADRIWIFGADLRHCPQAAARVAQAERQGGASVRFDIFSSSEPSGGKRTVAVPPGQFGLLSLLLQKAAFALDRIPPAVKAVPSFGALAAQWLPGKAPAPDFPSWLPEETLLDLARTFVEAKAPLAVIGERWLSAAGGEEATRQLLQALALFGAADRVVFLAGESNSWGVWDVLDPSKDEVLAMRDLLDPDNDRTFDALFLVGDDLLRRASDPDALARKLARTDTVVCIHPFPSETERHAHAVLPGCTFGESGGTATNLFGLVQRRRKAIEPPGASLPDREWAARLGRRLGFGDWPASDKGWFDAVRESVPSYGSPALARLYDDPDSTGVGREGTTALTFLPPAPLPPADGNPDFPLRLFFGTHPALWSTGSLSEREDLLRREVNQSVLHVSPADLAAQGLRTGAPVRVVHPRGEAVLTVRADERLPAGVLLAVPLPGGPGRTLRSFFRDIDSPGLGMQPTPVRLQNA